MDDKRLSQIESFYQFKSSSEAKIILELIQCIKEQERELESWREEFMGI